MKPHLHFMGIAGVGMSGLARWYLADGLPGFRVRRARQRRTSDPAASGGRSVFRSRRGPRGTRRHFGQQHRRTDDAPRDSGCLGTG